jgi:hypothetical protein
VIHRRLSYTHQTFDLYYSKLFQAEDHAMGSLLGEAWPLVCHSWLRSLGGVERRIMVKRTWLNWRTTLDHEGRWLSCRQQQQRHKGVYERTRGHTGNLFLCGDIQNLSNSLYLPWTFSMTLTWCGRTFASNAALPKGQRKYCNRNGRCKT